jgi:hypothetical protein
MSFPKTTHVSQFSHDGISDILITIWCAFNTKTNTVEKTMLQQTTRIALTNIISLYGLSLNGFSRYAISSSKLSLAECGACGNKSKCKHH